jgi:hypothetical protein
MSATKHRKFNAHRFLDKLQKHEPLLDAYLGMWPEIRSALPEPLTIAAFEDWLKYPSVTGPVLEDMLRGLYQVWDLATKHGEELMHEAIEIHGNAVDPGKELHKEALALALRVQDPVAFEFATNLLFAAQVEKFTTYRGKGSKAVGDVDGKRGQFETLLKQRFSERKGCEKILVKHFAEDDALNFIVYHEERVRAELQLQEKDRQVVVDTFTFRPARQDFLAYFPGSGKIEIDAGHEKDREILRKTFGEVFLEDADFFDSEGAPVVLNLEVLKDPGFRFELADGHEAKLTTLEYHLPQNDDPKFTVRSKNVFATLDANQMRPTLTASNQVQSARIRLRLREKGRAKTVTLSGKGTLSFNRSTDARVVLDYLSNWGLLVG